MKILLEKGDSEEKVKMAEALLANGLVSAIEKVTYQCVKVQKSDDEVAKAVIDVVDSFGVCTQWTAVYRVLVDFCGWDSDVAKFMKCKEKIIELKDSTIYQMNENCQVFNGPISGCVFAMPGSTVNQSPMQQITTERDAERESKSEAFEEPLRNFIFSEKLFDSNARLSKLRDTIAAAIDMGDATIMYGEPQPMRINPAVQNEWYYIVKAISESGVAKLKISDTKFVEQMVEWFPMLFPDETPETFKKYKRRLLKSISAERRIWKQGKMNIEVTLKEMWAKGISHLLGTAKAERVYDIAYKGLYINLTALKQDIAKEKATR